MLHKIRDINLLQRFLHVLADFCSSFCMKLTGNELSTPQYQLISSLHRARVSTTPCKIRKQRFSREQNKLLHNSIKLLTQNSDEKFIGLDDVQNVRLQRRHRPTDVTTDQRRHSQRRVSVHNTR